MGGCQKGEHFGSPLKIKQFLDKGNQRAAGLTALRGRIVLIYLLFTQGIRTATRIGASSAFVATARATRHVRTALSAHSPAQNSQSGHDDQGMPEFHLFDGDERRYDLVPAERQEQGCHQPPAEAPQDTANHRTTTT